MKRIAIVGGGIAGLSAAFYLEQGRRRGAELEYALYEASPRLGGVIRTERTADGWVVEAGPDSFLSEKPWARDLCRELGIEHRLIGSNDAARQTWVLHDGRLHPLPDGLQFLAPTRLLPILSTGLLSLQGKLRVAAEYLQRPRTGAEDESAAAFVERHFGREMVERLADPLLAGVYGGEAARLSARAVLPRLVKIEEQYGSLARGVLRTGNQGRQQQPQTAVFTTLKAGMQEMVEAVVSRLDAAALHVGAAVRRVWRRKSSWMVEAPQAAAFDAVILALPAPLGAELLAEAGGELAAHLRSIPYSSSVTVALAYDAAPPGTRGPALPSGFGYLAPRREGKRVLACTFVHNKFPGRAPGEGLLLRAFLGGTRDEAALQLSDDGLVRVVREELKAVLGLEAEPRFTRIQRWPRAMAQYEMGHLDRIEAIERLRQKLPGLYLVGNAYTGIGVPDCVRMGKEAAEAAIQQ